jgi:prepilin-type processing-associated H-X9-DG protein
MYRWRFGGNSDRRAYRGRVNRPIVGGLMLFACAGIVFAMFFLQPARTPPGHGLPSCSSILKKLGLASLMYSQDHDDRFPLASSWNAAAFPYLKNDLYFLCPQANSQRRPSYALNREMSGVWFERIAEPAGAILLFDSVPGANQSGGPERLPNPPRHQGGHYIAFADGHCSFAESARIPPEWWRPTLTELKVKKQTAK